MDNGKQENTYIIPWHHVWILNLRTWYGVRKWGSDMMLIVSLHTHLKNTEHEWIIITLSAQHIPDTETAVKRRPERRSVQSAHTVQQCHIIEPSHDFD